MMAQKPSHVEKTNLLKRWNSAMYQQRQITEHEDNNPKERICKNTRKSLMSEGDASSIFNKQ